MLRETKVCKNNNILNSFLFLRRTHATILLSFLLDIMLNICLQIKRDDFIYSNQFKVISCHKIRCIYTSDTISSFPIPEE